MANKIAIIGAGSSGLYAANICAKNGAQVVLIEHGPQAGRKLLCTGNGRCNLTNASMDESYYDSFSEKNALIKELIESHTPSDVLCNFKEMGLLTHERNGYYYPYSDQAQDVRDVLVNSCIKNGVRILYNLDIYSSIRKLENGKFAITTDIEEEFDAVILCCGGKSAKATGSDGSGFGIAQKFGHTKPELYPALVPLHINDPDLHILTGVRCRGMISLYIQDQLAQSDIGELQFTNLGISGIPTFQISGKAVLALSNLQDTYIRINFLPDYSEEELSDILGPSLEPHAVGLVNRKIIEFLSLKANLSNTEPDWKELLCSYKFCLSGHGNLEHAQVTQGGISFEEVGRNLESAFCKGLFFAGEMLDVNGKCGGYNLHFAWASAYRAALEACHYDSN